MPAARAAVLLAAGRGERMRAALPDAPPKPLVMLAGRPLCWYAAQAILQAGYGRRLAVVPPARRAQRWRQSWTHWALSV
ncbi:NTP transferase domain-containing protein [Deinococcus lacus]|uniref:NTP transferase domain-containing protein n=1 Tax=Deinococcus lacus TaxID=392561 RepID=A0ABW1YH23_9DEIO